MAGDFTPSQAIALGRWKLIEHLDSAGGPSRFELFDRDADPLDQVDVADRHPDVVADLAAKLEAWRRWALERRVEADSIDSMTAEELERLRSLGYS